MLSHPPLVAEWAALSLQATSGGAAGIQLEVLSRSTEVVDPLSVPDAETGDLLHFTQSNTGLHEAQWE